MRDSVLRGVIEAYAVDRAVAYYVAQGADEIEVVGKPYDLKVMINGSELHVEVKGSMGDGMRSVNLTQGEVDRAYRWTHTDLLLVGGIRVGQSSGSFSASEGSVRAWRGCKPSQNDLRPAHLRYALPHDEPVARQTGGDARAILDV